MKNYLLAHVVLALLVQCSKELHTDEAKKSADEKVGEATSPVLEAERAQADDLYQKQREASVRVQIGMSWDEAKAILGDPSHTFEAANETWISHSYFDRCILSQCQMKNLPTVGLK